jgi:hypothetical protein
MPHRLFSQTILRELLDQIPQHVKFELHAAETLVDFKSLDVSKPNCILVHWDVICDKEFNHAVDTISTGAQKYLDLVNYNPTTNFILMYGSQLAERELIHDRLHLVRYTSALAAHKVGYQQLAPACLKNFDSEKNFICLNRHPRQHRINLVSYLLGLSLENHGTISFRDTFHVDTEWIDRVSWELTDTQIKKIKPILIQGFNKTKKINLENNMSQVDTIYATHKHNDNPKNFNLNLRNIYENHFVEIVSETLFNTPTVGISEKFLNSVYGYVFPIVIGGQGVVKVLSTLGFDMFEDIIDQSYDNISDPLDRLCAAINLNKSLLVDNYKIKNLWRENQHRFDNNIKFAKTKMYEVIRQQAHNDFSQVEWKL